MRIRTLSWLAGAALLATVSQANAVDLDPPGGGLLFSGTVDAWVGAGFLSVDVEPAGGGEQYDDNGHGIGGINGYVSIPINDMWSVQLDGEGAMNIVSDGGDDNYQHSILGGMHLSYRDPSHHLLGIFGAAGNADGGENGGSNPTAMLYTLGAEGQIYWDNITLYGQGGWLDSEDDGDGDSLRDGFFARGVARYFLDDNSKLEGEFSFAHGDCDDDDTCDIFGWGAEYERAIHPGGLSWFVGYNGFYGENNGEGDKAEEHVIFAGLRILFGAPSLLDKDRRGSTLNLPDAGRWVAMTAEALD